LEAGSSCAPRGCTLEITDGKKTLLDMPEGTPDYGDGIEVRAVDVQSTRFDYHP
jgi:hypothetical protein